MNVRQSFSLSFSVGAIAILACSCSEPSEPGNVLPVAVINSPSHDTTVVWPYSVNFQGSANDSDGRVVSHHWDFGDGYVEEVEDPFLYAYGAAGTYTVSYQVTDNEGAVSLPAQVVVTVEEPAGVAPEPGEYHDITVFGQLSFGVNDQGTALTNMTFLFENWVCGGAPRNERITADQPSGWPITDGEFTVEASFPELDLDMTAAGRFDTNNYATGTWSIVSNGRTCDGEWGALKTPGIVVSVSDDFSSTLGITGSNWVPGRMVTLEVDRGDDGTVDFTATTAAQGGGGEYAWFYDGEAPPYDLAEGDLLRMYDVTHDVEYAVLYVTLDSVDHVTDVVSGSAREFTWLGVGIKVPAGPYLYFQVDESGTWSADFSELYNVSAGTNAWVTAGCSFIGPEVPCYGYTSIGGGGLPESQAVALDGGKPVTSGDGVRPARIRVGRAVDVDRVRR